MVTFDHIGNMVSAPDYIHATVDIDMDKLETHVMAIQSAIDSVNRISSYDREDPRIDAIMVGFEGRLKAIGLDIRALRFVNQLTPSRPKRQIGILFASILGIGSTFLAIHNTVELNKLASEQRRLRTTMSATLHIIEAMETRLNEHEGIINRNVIAIKKLEAANEASWRMQISLAYGALIEASCSVLAGQIGQIGDILSTVMNSRRIHPTLFHGHQIERLFAQLRTMAKASGSELVISHPSHLFQIDTSFVQTKNGFRMFLHVPTSKSTKRLSVFFHAPLPVELDDGVMVRVHEDKDVIAINQDRTEYRVMTAAELHQCNKVEETFICQRQNILSTDFSQSCLASLFKRDPESIKMRCQVSLAPMQDEVYQTGDNTFILYSGKASMGRLTCVGQETRDFTIEVGHNTIQVPSGCTASSPFHRFSASDNNKLAANDTGAGFAWDIKGLKILSEITTPEFRSQLTTINTTGSMPTNIHTLRAAFDAQAPTGWMDNASFSSSMSFTAFGIGLVGILFVGFVTFNQGRRMKTMEAILNPASPEATFNWSKFARSITMIPPNKM